MQFKFHLNPEVKISPNVMNRRFTEKRPRAGTAVRQDFQKPIFQYLKVHPRNDHKTIIDRKRKCFTAEDFF